MTHGEDITENIAEYDKYAIEVKKVIFYSAAKFRKDNFLIKQIYSQ